MKPIKITQDNLNAIASALESANGSASAHTATSHDVLTAAKNAEIWLEDMGIPTKSRSGASVTWVSGDNLPRSYSKNYGRKVIRTGVTIERRPSGWYMSDARRIEQYASIDTMGNRMTLTKAQDEIAVAKLRAGYRVAA